MPACEALVLKADFGLSTAAHYDWLIVNIPPLSPEAVLTESIKRCHIHICLRLAAPGQTFPGSLSTCYLRKHQAKVTVAGGDGRGIILLKAAAATTSDTTTPGQGFC